MLHSATFERLPEAVLRAAGHWDTRHHSQPETPAASATRQAMTIAISRQTGTRGEEIAREVGRMLDWPVFDHELLEQIAAEMQVRVDLLESVDEQHQSWLLESLEALAPKATVSETSYLRHLVETVCSLAAHGECVIVGRGAAQFLPGASTLRVRIVAPKADRIAQTQRRENCTHREAERMMTTRERQRIAFVKEHFQKDAADPWHYDLVLNTQHWSAGDCAELIVAALKLKSTSAD